MFEAINNFEISKIIVSLILKIESRKSKSVRVDNTLNIIQMKKVSSNMFSSMENEKLNSSSMTKVLGGARPHRETSSGEWGGTVAHSGYPNGDSGRYVSGGIELDAANANGTTPL